MRIITDYCRGEASSRSPEAGTESSSTESFVPTEEKAGSREQGECGECGERYEADPETGAIALFKG